MPIKRLALVVTTALALLALTGVADAAGSWSAPYDVPGLAAATNGASEIRAISCASFGDVCMAAGEHEDLNGDPRAFLTIRTNGAWGAALDLTGVTAGPGITTLIVRAVSCSPEGACSILGDYTIAGVTSSFVATGGDAIEVPGLAALNTGDFSMGADISCTAVGECTATGSFRDSSSATKMWTVQQVGGVWGSATERTIVGPYLNIIPESISCSAPGECSIVGSAYDLQSDLVTVDSTGGVWGTPDVTTSPSGVDSTYSSVSCPASGECVAVGSTNSGTEFVTVRTAGVWGSPGPIPNVSVLAGGGGAAATSVSCWAAGACVAAGGAGPNGARNAWVADMTGGAWGDAAFVPGATTLGGPSGVKHVSCSTNGLCVVGGQFDATGSYNAWGSVREGGAWTNVHTVPLSANPMVGDYADPDGAACAPTICFIGGGFTASNTAGVAWMAEFTSSPDPEPTTTTTAADGPVTPAFAG